MLFEEKNIEPTLREEMDALFPQIDALEKLLNKTESGKLERPWTSLCLLNDDRLTSKTEKADSSAKKQEKTSRCKEALESIRHVGSENPEVVTIIESFEKFFDAHPVACGLEPPASINSFK